jgi:hypothetical protein
MSHDRVLSIRVAAVALATFCPALAGAQAPTILRDSARELACGPQAALVEPVAPMRIIGGPEHGRAQFASGDAVVINAGSAQGVKQGQEFFVRRAIKDRFVEPTADKAIPVSIRTAGWLTIVDVRTETSIARITHACDSIVEGDYLEPFVLPVPAAAGGAGEPDFANPGRVILGDERRQMGSPGSLMVVDRGSDHGLRAGQQLTIFREDTAGGTVQRVGTATVVKVSPESSMFRIETARDAVYVGDKVAIHKDKKN